MAGWRSADGTYQPVGDLADLEVPPTLLALIAARLDALDPAVRSLLQDAAVLGQTFTPASLAAVSGRSDGDLPAALRDLVRQEVLALNTDPRSPERGQYGFVQALIREVAYGTLSRPIDARGTSRRPGTSRRWATTRSARPRDPLPRRVPGVPEGAEAEAIAGQARIALRAAAERAAGLGSPPRRRLSPRAWR